MLENGISIKFMLKNSYE
ncbi:unnamed protein product [Chironomus riparius]|uniref:Uncharacterized protein n=1 Tax=Chironomus riparius TaxID=315576 RepID=A0A9N9WVA5_9DIPT|nr:unnamed protein product [Chironomus riparius]